jgi:Tol biopolymer transport system component
MLRLRVMFVAVLALAVVAVAAVPSGAASSPSAKFCSAYTKISGGSDQPTPKQAKALAARFKAAGKQAPAKVKSAANTIVGVLNKLGSISSANPADLGKFYTSADFRKYGQAIGTFFKYASACDATN